MLHLPHDRGRNEPLPTEAILLGKNEAPAVSRTE